jgi:PAS domain S-box-containing protein
MVKYLRQHLTGSLIAAVILVWMILATAGVTWNRNRPGDWEEMFAYSFTIPILLASFYFGRAAGTGVALIASLVSGSLAIGQPGLLASPVVQRVLFQVGLFNATALVTTALSEREQEAQARYRSLFDGVPVGLYRASPTGQFLDVNQALVKILGYPDRKSLLAVDPSSLYLEAQDRQKWLEVLDEKGLLQNFETRLQCGDKKIIWARENTQAIQNVDGKVLWFEGSLEDITERKQAEAALRESESRFRLLAENSTDMISRHSPEGSYLYVSPACQTLLGYAPEELVGHSPFEFIQPDDLAAVEQNLATALSRPGGATVVFRAQRKDGHAIWLETISHAIRDAQSGEPVEIHAATRNVTERKRAEEALARSEALYRQAIMAAGAVPYYRDYRTGAETYTFMGEGVIQLTGYSAAEITPAIFDQLEQESLMRGSLAHLTQSEAGLLSEAGKIHHWACDYRILTRDGQTRWVSDSAVQIRDEYDQRIGVIGILQDVTARKQAEEALLRERNFSDAVINRLPGIFVISDLRWMVRWNKNLEHVSEYSEEELSHMSFAHIIAEEDRPLMQEKFREVINGSELEIEGHLLSKSGKKIPYYLTGSSLNVDNQGYVLLIGLDLTARKQAEAELREYREHLEELIQERTLSLENANKELESFSYSVSHDLRAPLRAIEGFSRILETEHASSFSPEAARLLNAVRVSSKQMALLIEGLLKFSRLGRQAITKQTLQPAELVRQALETLSNEREDRNVDLSIGELPACEGDPVLLLQVWVNLLSNALKYTRRREFARIELGCQSGENGEQIYYVKDNGVGFDMRYADKLFGVFQRLHSAEQFEGTGIGLALVERIIHRHGGRIWVEAQPDQGATFYFVLA